MEAGVYVVRGTAELMAAVDEVLSHLSTEARLENFPDLALL